MGKAGARMVAPRTERLGKTLERKLARVTDIKVKLNAKFHPEGLTD